MKAEKLEKLLRLIGGPTSAELRIWAPLRICPLGAHVDHQGGVVTGMSVDRGVLLIGRASSEFRVQSLELPGEVRLDVGSTPGPRQGDWGDYPRAALLALQKNTPIRYGFQGALSGDLPGMGLSSSAALLSSLILALAVVNDCELDRKDVARLVKEAENSYLGLSSGLLDPSMILFAQEKHLTVLDCGGFELRQIPFPAEQFPLEIVVAFSGLSRRLVSSGYNNRVAECREAARRLLGPCAQVENPSLCMVPSDHLTEKVKRLPLPLRKRAQHYFGEVRRVHEGCDAWSRGDLVEFGRLVNLSGCSSVENYESGTPELITLDRLLRTAPGVYGSRFSGGGFGGCCIALAEPGFGREMIQEIERAYARAHPEAAEKALFTVCRPAGPATVSLEVD